MDGSTGGVRRFFRAILQAVGGFLTGFPVIFSIFFSGGGRGRAPPKINSFLLSLLCGV